MGTGAEEMNQPLKADLEKPAALTAVMGRATPSFKEQDHLKLMNKNYTYGQLCTYCKPSLVLTFHK